MYKWSNSKHKTATFQWEHLVRVELRDARAKGVLAGHGGVVEVAALAPRLLLRMCHHGVRRRQRLPRALLRLLQLVALLLEPLRCNTLVVAAALLTLLATNRMRQGALNLCAARHREH